MLAPYLSRSAAIALASALVASAGLVQSPRAYAQEAASKAKDEKGKWVPLFQRHAGEYVIRVGEDAKGEARRLPEPVLRWWQPVRLRGRGFSDTCQGGHRPGHSKLAADALLLAPSP